MEIILLITVVICFAANIFITHFFLKRLSRKLTSQFIPSFSTTSTATAGDTYSVPFSTGTSGTTDVPAENEVMKENKDEMDFAENVFSSVPSDLKVEVEGGDANTPPGYEDKK